MTILNTPNFRPDSVIVSPVICGPLDSSHIMIHWCDKDDSGGGVINVCR